MRISATNNSTVLVPLSLAAKATEIHTHNGGVVFIYEDNKPPVPTLDEIFARLPGFRKVQVDYQT